MNDLRGPPPADVALRNRLGLLCLEAELAADRIEDIQGWLGVGRDARRTLPDIVADLRAAVTAACTEPAPPEPVVLRDAYGEPVPDWAERG